LDAQAESLTKAFLLVMERKFVMHTSAYVESEAAVDLGLKMGGKMDVNGLRMDCNWAKCVVCRSVFGAKRFFSTGNRF
jgi:hypothetical protein